MSEVKFKLVIIDPKLEITILNKLSEAGFTCTGRHLDLADLPQLGQEETILITTAQCLESKRADRRWQRFLATFSIGETSIAGANSLTESEIEKLPDMITEVLLKISTDNNYVSKEQPLVKGVLPRVGVTTLIDIIERNIGDLLLTRRKWISDNHRQVLLAEIDDHSILALCTELEFFQPGGNSNYLDCAVVINKVPATAKARKRLQAIERELEGSGIGLFLPIFFDTEIPVSGKASKQTIRAMHPLFDWIAKSN